jgi:hypothetical protein
MRCYRWGICWTSIFTPITISKKHIHANSCQFKTMIKKDASFLPNIRFGLSLNARVDPAVYL